MHSPAMTGYLANLFNPIMLFGAVGTLALLSVVFKENKVYRLFEHIYLGLALGYDLVINWTDVLRPFLWDPMTAGPEAQWAWVMVIPIGLMFYGSYTKRFAWFSRLIFGFFFGLVAGTVFQDTCQRSIPQITKTYKLKPLYPPAPSPGDLHPHLHAASFVINNALFLGILLCVLVYFFFAFEMKNKILLGMSKTGRLVLMFAFGAMFGATIMTRMALLIDRMYFIFVQWLQWAPK